MSPSDRLGCGGRNPVFSPRDRETLCPAPPSAGSSATTRASTPSRETCLKSLQGGTRLSVALVSHALTCLPGGRRPAQVGLLVVSIAQNESLEFCVADSLCICITGVNCSQIQVSNNPGEFSLTSCLRPKNTLALTLCLFVCFFVFKSTGIRR